MASVQESIDRLQYKIAGIIENHEVWTTLHDVANSLGFQSQDTEGLGKSKYLIKLTTSADDKTVISAAKQILKAYPGNRGKPTDADLQQIQDALWWIECNGVQRISKVTRYKIAESLERIPFWGRLSIREFFNPVLPSIATDYSLPEAGNDGFLYTGLSLTAFSNLFSNGQSKLQPSRISATAFFREIGIADLPDERLFLMLERMVHPEVQSLNLQSKLVSQFNSFLLQDNFELRKEGVESGVPIYKAREKSIGVLGTPKYIIFASTGHKPDIVIDDAVNMDIRIVRYADQCLVYDQPLQGELTWQMLLEWWATKRGLNSSENETRQELGRRLRDSLQSEPERIFFDTYFKMVKPKYGINLPALLPQVYLHYDPRARSERNTPFLVRQRMDFLMLLPNANRIVIEIDGSQHYADNDGRASPSRYAEMVSEDRRIRILGYEVYRFGGAEFKTLEQISKTIVAFFDELFSRYKIRAE